jgi:hypothetical protein
MESMKNDAKMIAMQSEKGNGKQTLQRPTERHGGVSAQKMCKRVTDFVNRKKKADVSIESHNTAWSEEMRKLTTAGMPLPEMFKFCLYLLSLGDEYKMFRTVASMATEA